MPGAVGYGLTPRGARKLISYYETTYLPADNAMNTMVVKLQCHNYLMGRAATEKDGKRMWKPAFPADLDSPEAEDSRKMLAGMSFILNKGLNANYQPTDEDKQFVKDHLGISGKNETDLSSIAQAYGMWKNVSSGQSIDEMSVQEIATDREFNFAYNMSPAEFAIQGDKGANIFNVDASINSEKVAAAQKATNEMIKVATTQNSIIDNATISSLNNLQKQASTIQGQIDKISQKYAGGLLH